MNSSQLTLLRCPYCKGKFTPNLVLVKQKNSVLYGSVYCACDEFPILFGILYLHKNRASYILDCLRKNNYLGALSKAFDCSYRILRIAHVFNPSLTSIIPQKDLLTEKRLRWFWRYIFRQPTEDYNYYIYRNRSIPSLLAFFPLGYLSKNKKVIWLDIGSAVYTYYKQIIHDFPLTTFISIETIFAFQYLNAILHPSQNTIRICADTTYGSFVKPHSIDVTTYIDSLYCIPQQRKSIQSNFQYDLKKSGFVFASGLFEHAYFPLKSTPYFPISRTLISQYANSPIVFFDNEKLSLCLKNNSKHVAESIIGEKDSFFRFCALWPTKIFRNKWSYTIPKHIRDTSTHLMTKSNVIWHNAVY